MTEPVALELPAGYGMVPIARSQWYSGDHADFLSSLKDKLLIWEKPKRGCRYVIPVDVSSGVGLDNSVIEVIRVGDITEPDEEVAQFVSDQIDPVELAYYIDPIANYYKDGDGQGALVAIECNGMGGTTQSELLHHIGYSNLYIWQHEDARSARGRYTRAFGWYTNSRTRPIMLARLHRSLTSLDERSGLPELRINSPHTIEEMRDFYAPPGAPMWMAESQGSAHDDCLMATAIGSYVVQTMRLERGEPIAEQRRRVSEESARRKRLAEGLGQKVDFISSDCTADEMLDREDDGPEAWDPLDRRDPLESEW